MIAFERPHKPTLGLPEIYGGIGAGLLVAARFVPLARLPFWGCPMRRQLGIPCLSCGMTRSFDWFMRGRFLDSLEINPLGFLLAIAALVSFAYLVMYLLRMRPPRVVAYLNPEHAFAARLAAGGLLLANWGWVIAHGLAVRGG